MENNKSMISKHLKYLRTMKGMTVREVAEKINKGHAHLSLIENGRVNPADETIIEILIKGFDFRPSEAKDIVAQWRIEDALKKASNPKQVINNIRAWNNSTIVTGDNNTIN